MCTYQNNFPRYGRTQVSAQSIIKTCSQAGTITKSNFMSRLQTTKPWLMSTTVATFCQYTTHVSLSKFRILAINRKFVFHVSKLQFSAIAPTCGFATTAVNCELMLMFKHKTPNGFTSRFIHMQQRAYDHAADTANLLDIRPIVVAYTHFRTLDWFRLPGISIPVAIPSRTIVPPSLRNPTLTITALQPLVIPPIVIIVPTFGSPVGPIFIPTFWNFIQLALLSFSLATFRAFYAFGTFLVPHVRLHKSRFAFLLSHRPFLFHFPGE